MKFPQHVWIVIPVYNHASTVREVVLRTLELCPRVVVIDDGSTDGNIVELLKETGVKVISHSCNKGKGVALRTAARFISEYGGTYIITLDADGQHDPDDVRFFLPYLVEDSKNIVIGARVFNSENIPERSKFGRKISDFWVRFETGQKVRDSQSGFRAYPVRLLREVSCVSERYDFETEILVRGAWAGLNIVNVDISVYYPERSRRITHFDFLIDNLRIFLLHIRLLWRKFLPVPYKRIF